MRTVFIIFFTFLLYSCSPDVGANIDCDLVKLIYSEATKIMDGTEVEKFQYVEISEDLYPNIYSLNPLKVYIREDGLFIRIKKRFSTETGYFIPNDQNKTFSDKGDPSFKKLCDHIYEYKYY